MVFIDGQNFYHGLRHALPGKNVDFEPFAGLLVGQRQLVHVRYYNVHLRQQGNVDRAKRHERFLEAVSSIPDFHVYYGRMVVRPYGTAEKGVDVQMAVHMLQQGYQDNYDTAVLVSGDGDFDHAVRAVVDLGKRVENAYFSSGRSRALVNCCSRFLMLDEPFLKPCLSVQATPPTGGP